MFYDNKIRLKGDINEYIDVSCIQQLKFYTENKT